MASRELKELLSVIKQRDAQLELAKGEAEERDHLLRATKHAIEQLQAELGNSRRENEALKEEARKVRLEGHGANRPPWPKVQAFPLAWLNA